MRSYVIKNKAVILPLGIASAVMSLIMTAAVLFNEVSPSIIL